MRKFKDYLKASIVTEKEGINEGANKVDLQNLGGGWEGDVYVDIGKYGETDKIRISLGLYSGGTKTSHIYPNDKNLTWEDARKVREDLEKDFGKSFKKLLEKFDKDTKKLLDVSIKKVLK